MSYVLVLLQPTSPLRTHIHIDECIDTYISSKAESAISVCAMDSEVLKYFTLTDNRLNPISNSRYPFARRQDLPTVVKPNGAIYVINIDTFLSYNSLLTRNTVPYFMLEQESVDIDTIEDFHLAERIIEGDLT